MPAIDGADADANVVLISSLILIEELETKTEVHGTSSTTTNSVMAGDSDNNNCVEYIAHMIAMTERMVMSSLRANPRGDRDSPRRARHLRGEAPRHAWVL